MGDIRILKIHLDLSQMNFKDADVLFLREHHILAFLQKLLLDIRFLPENAELIISVNELDASEVASLHCLFVLPLQDNHFLFNGVDKLNSIINSIEKEMVILKRKYEQAVETRNFTGIQLIDRNDELCILWEKSNIQEKLLKKGEAAMLTKSEEIRSLKIDLKEVKRQLHVVQKKIPEVPKLIDEVMRLREQVSSVRKRTDELSLELENPKSLMRKWRGLGGEDLDLQTLRMKTQDLEESS